MKSSTYCPLIENAISTEILDLNLDKSQSNEMINYIKLTPTHDISSIINILKSWDKVRKTDYKTTFEFLRKY